MKAATGALYAYDDIGNRTASDEVGRGVLTGNGTSTPTTIDTASPNTSLRTTGYGTAATPGTSNALNQSTRITHPAFFNVRGTRAASSQTVGIVVNGDPVDNPGSADSSFQPTNSGTYFRDEVPNTTPSGTTTPDLYEPVQATQQIGTQTPTPLTLDDPVQYVPPPIETLSYDLAGNLVTDGRWTYTWDGAERLIKMVSLPFNQPAAGAVPSKQVKGLTVEFTYDAFSRRVGKKVSELSYMQPGAPTLVSWEAYVYDGWNMIGTYSRHLSGSTAGKGKERLATHVWGPDLGSRLEAGWDWQAAGGVGGLLMTLYPMPSVNVPTYIEWLAGQGVYETTQIGYEDGNGGWVPYYGEYTGPFYDENNNWISEYGGYNSPYGFLTYSMATAYSLDYGHYTALYEVNHRLHVPVMDHMGNVTSVVRLLGSPGSGSSAQTEFLYDYDAFGKELRASALIAGSNPDGYPFRFSTKFTDTETGLVYYGYRFYDPANGRWINRDPIEEEGGLNLYGMVDNDLVCDIDIFGFGSFLTPQGTAAAVGAGVGAAAKVIPPTAKHLANVAKMSKDSVAKTAARAARKAEEEAAHLSEVTEMAKKSSAARKAAEEMCKKGGGKTGRKLNKDALENGKKKIDEARKKFEELDKKMNKTKAMKEERDKAGRELKKAINDMQKSENHAQRAQ